VDSGAIPGESELALIVSAIQGSRVAADRLTGQGFEPETLYQEVRRTGPSDNHPFLFKSTMPALSPKCL
jgi:hypothetical protein